MEKIITERDFFECSGGMMPTPFQSKQLKVYHKSEDKFIVETDVSTISIVDFGCKKIMLLYAVVAAIAALIAALCVATGGTALIAICAIAGLAGAAWGAVIGSLICGQLVAPARKWLGNKGDMIILGYHTINGQNYMECDAFVFLGMNPEFIRYNPNIKSWSQALAKGAAALIQNLFEGMMAGALIGTAGAAISGLVAGASGGAGMAGVGRTCLQFVKSIPKNFIGNIVESFSTFGLGMRGVMGGTNVLAAYGETGEMDLETADQAFSDGFWSPETGAIESVQNIYNGQATWQDVGGIILMFSPVGESKRQVIDGESPRVTIDGDGLGRNTDDVARNADDAARNTDDADPNRQSQDGEPIELGSNRVGAIGEADIVARLQDEGYEVLQIQNNSGHGVDIIARDADGNVKCIEVKSNSSTLSDAQRQGGESFVNDRLDRATSNSGHYKIPPNSEQMATDAQTAKNWIRDADNVDYEVRKVDVDRKTGEVSNHRAEEWDAKPARQRRK